MDVGHRQPDRLVPLIERPQGDGVFGESRQLRVDQSQSRWHGVLVEQITALYRQLIRQLVASPKGQRPDVVPASTALANRHAKQLGASVVEVAKVSGQQQAINPIV